MNLKTVETKSFDLFGKGGCRKIMTVNVQSVVKGGEVQKLKHGKVGSKNGAKIFDKGPTSWNLNKSLTSEPISDDLRNLVNLNAS